MEFEELFETPDMDEQDEFIKAVEEHHIRPWEEEEEDRAKPEDAE